jgi:Flp pilus assembly protein CpaB
VGVVNVRQELVVEGAYSQVDLVVGETTNYYIAKGEVITSSRVGPPEVPQNVPPISVVPQGMRAMAFNIDPNWNTQGNLLPGDRMDVLAAYNGPDTATTIVENVEVLVVAQAPDTVGSVTVTFALDAKHAEVLAEAQEKATKLSVAVLRTGPEPVIP